MKAQSLSHVVNFTYHQVNYTLNIHDSLHSDIIYIYVGKYNMTRPDVCWPMPVPSDDPFYNEKNGKNPPK